MPYWIRIVYIIGCAQGFFLALLLLIHRKNRTAHRLLALILFFLSFEILNLVLAAASGSQISAQTYIQVYVLTEPVAFLFGPLYYLYISFFSKQRQLFILRDLLHGIPFLIHLFYNLMFFVQPPDKQIALVTKFSSGHMDPLDYIAVLGIFVHLVVYFILSYLQLLHYSRQIEEVSSNTHRRNLIWLRVMTSLCLFLSFVGGGSYLYFAHTGEESLIMEYIFSFSVLLVIYYTGYKTYTESEVLAPLGFPSQGGKYGKNRLEVDKLESEFQRLTDLVLEEKLFLDEDLTINALAERMDIQPYQLSQIINSTSGKSFFNFVNTYRIDYARKLLADKEFAEYTVLRIAFESGFNSKATFNSVFKKLTGVTPTQYRKNQLQ